MNLNENIHRIKEVMGIINEGIPSSLLRRAEELPKHIKSAYTWLNPRAFNSLDEFIDRVIFGTTRDFVSEAQDKTYEEQLEIRKSVEPIVRRIVLHEFFDEIRDYYYR